jgi:hypothetical protein
MLDELAGQVRSGRIDPVDLVEESLRRIAADDHNAVIRVEADSARAAAATHPRIGPLAGLPLPPPGRRPTTDVPRTDLNRDQGQVRRLRDNSPIGLLESPKSLCLPAWLRFLFSDTGIPTPTRSARRSPTQA